MWFTPFRLLGALTLVMPLAALAAPFAYVPNEGSGSLSVIDTATDQVVGEIAAGKEPRGIVVSADGRTVYVSDQPNNQLVVVDIASRKATGVIALGESPEGVGISPDGRWVAAAVEETNNVAFVDTRTQRKAFVVKVRGKNPEHAVFAPDGRHVFVSAEEGEAVDVIDVARREQVAQIAVGARPRGIGFSPDGKRAYVAAENSNEVYVLDAVGFSVVAKIKAGLRSNGIAVQPDGKRVVRVERRRLHGLGDRCRQPRHHRNDSGRAASVEHGTHAGRQETLRRVRAFRIGIGHRRRARRENRRRSRGQAAVGRHDPLIRPASVASATCPSVFSASRMRLGPEVTICWFVYCARRSAMEPTLATFGILQQRASSRLMRHLSYDAAVELGCVAR